ncbi:hypothetical protein GCM10010994_28080 [Chelatococcus reniformis]|uniref:Uncharacterized protein n=2 Tax=Chelatococcus reniformis TaxID=1494448 RepID=A0A916UD31_9HYPH|nr:hypothetical protein GCM10010994_28080 [Chelatococcus reniformis]
MVSDSMSFFKVRKPLTVDGLPVVAVFGFDETGEFPFARGPGTSPGQVFGITTATDSAALERWIRNHPGKFILVDTPSALGAGLTDVYCSRRPGD